MKLSTLLSAQAFLFGFFTAALFSGNNFAAAAQQLVLSRGNSTILVQPYAPNIVRVSISLLRDYALASPGYGISAAPSSEGWLSRSDESGDVFRSSKVVVTIAPEGVKVPSMGTAAD